MGLGEFRLLLDDYVKGRSEGSAVRKTLADALDRTVTPVEASTKRRKKITLNHNQKKPGSNQLVELKLDDLYSIGSRKLKRASNDGHFVVLNFKKWSMDKVGQKGNKAFDYNIYENHIKDLIEAIVVLISDRKCSSATVGPISKLKTFKYEGNVKEGVEAPSMVIDLSHLCKAK